MCVPTFTTHRHALRPDPRPPRQGFAARRGRSRGLRGIPIGYDHLDVLPRRQPRHAVGVPRVTGRLPALPPMWTQRPAVVHPDDTDAFPSSASPGTRPSISGTALRLHAEKAGLPRLSAADRADLEYACRLAGRRLRSTSARPPRRDDQLTRATQASAARGRCRTSTVPVCRRHILRTVRPVDVHGRSGSGVRTTSTRNTTPASRFETRCVRRCLASSPCHRGRAALVGIVRVAARPHSAATRPAGSTLHGFLVAATW